MKKARDSRFELLRIIAMIMIVSFHAFNQIGSYDVSANRYIMLKDETGFSVNFLGLTVLGSWGITGVGCFFLIAAYFLQKKNCYSTVKALKIVFQTIFWALIMLFAAKILGAIPHYESFGLKLIAKAVIAPLIDEYWYIPSYLLMYILSPFMNTIIEKLELDFYKRLIVVLTLIIPVYSTVFYKDIAVCCVVLAVYYYLLWGYLKQTEGNFFERNAKIIFVISATFIIALASLGYAFGFYNAVITRLCGRFSGFQVLTALSLFYIFKNKDVPSNKYINFIASGTLGVYLIHENPYFRFYLWNDIFKLYDRFDKPYFLVIFILAVLLVFIISALLDIVRGYLFDKTLNKALKCMGKYFERFDKYING